MCTSSAASPRHPCLGGPSRTLTRSPSHVCQICHLMKTPSSTSQQSMQPFDDTQPARSESCMPAPASKQVQVTPCVLVHECIHVCMCFRARPPACTSDMCCLQRFHRTWLNQPSHRGKREEQSKGAGSQTPEMSRFERTTLQVLSVIEFIVPKYKY